jgi:uncharacterized protein (DUF58 family)
MAAPRSLPSADVSFRPDFSARVSALQLRLGGALLRREGSGGGAISGSGEDLAGFRPYGPGEDLRQLDWNLLARLDRPFVRVTRREAGEDWVVALDASASMGVGPPGKLQRAAECAAALASLGARQGATVRLLVSHPGNGDGVASRGFTFRPKEGLAGLFAFLEGLRAEGSDGLGSLLRTPQLFGAASRVFCVGDLFSCDLQSLVGLRRGARELVLLQLLAPVEFDPPLGSVAWWDPEGGESLDLFLDESALTRYRALLEQRLESWRRSASAHRIRHSCRSTLEEFEDLVHGLVRP